MPAHGKRRALGQHFLTNRSIADLIADTTVREATESGCTRILEIGPGKGAITDPILNRLKNHPTLQEMVLVEKDFAFGKNWKSRSKDFSSPRLKVEEGDFLDLDQSKWLSDHPFGVVSNLPYSAGTAILTRMAAHPSKIRFMILMFQAEVAQRIRAEVGTKAWGSLSIWIQNQWDILKIVSVPPGAFTPPPDVQSEVVLLKPRQQQRIPIPSDERSHKLWETLLKVCFAHRRKMLRSGLRAQNLYQNALEQSGVDDTKRAEQLSWEEWDRIYRALLAQS